MVIVGTDPVEVDRALRSGELGCPACGGGLRPWGHARQRVVRLAGGEERRRPRRAVCGKCLVTHVLLAEDCLLRRRDGVEVIGSALAAKAKGAGARLIARRLGREVTTVRGWLRRFAARAEEVRVFFTGWAHRLDPELEVLRPAGSVLADAVEAVGVAARAASARLGPRLPWRFAAAVTRGGLLATPAHPYPAG